MATTKKTTALAVVDSFQIVNRYEGIDPELMAELQDELSDLDPESGITCRQIKVPSGGGLAFEVQGEDENDAEPMKQIDAVIVFTHRVSAYWPGAYGSGDDAAKIPVCSSMDGKMGFNPSTGEVTACETCPYNQYGTGVDENGNPIDPETGYRKDPETGDLYDPGTGITVGGESVPDVNIPVNPNIQ